jgi:thiol:disulfide interchange protein DsbD
VIALLLLTVAAQAPAIPKVIVSVAEPEEVRVVAGGSAVLELVATISEGFRIQANPASDRFLVPASLELEDDERVRLGPVEYPPGKPYRLRGASDDLSIYEGTVEIRVPLEATLSSAPGGESVAVMLKGTLRYQACNDIVCLKPSSVPVRLPVRIGPVRNPPGR